PLLASGTMTDITARKQEEEIIRFMATHDGLTGVPNRSLARDRFTMAMNMSRRHDGAVAVMFIDLDSFKPVNDKYGHEAGDAVLKEVANRLCASVRDTDTVARIGGDEFMLVITEVKDRAALGSLAEKIIRRLMEPIVFRRKKIHIGASIGIAVAPADGENIDGLIKLADEAMYEVKTSGKNGFAFVGG
ncbi:MAG: GGDEF domain-containing protein, partial [Planctomycetes bacterium]|nr:GGDEF domain-containing protein [Planctomycetota bacterium]